jgi:hypothetical protein
MSQLSADSSHQSERGLDLAALVSGKEMISFAGSYLMFIVSGHETTQSQRMTLASAALFSGGGREDQFVTLCEDLMGGRAHDPKQLIAVPTYGYRMVLSENEHAIYREYMPPRLGSDNFGLNDDLFSSYWWTIDARPARLLTSPGDVARAVNDGLLINGFARKKLDSGRTCALQFPIRYFSVAVGEEPKFHAEAGPVLVPRLMLGMDEGEAAQDMCIAQFAFNRWDEAELAVWGAEPSEAPSSRWFSRISKLSAELYLLASPAHVQGVTTRRRGRRSREPMQTSES